MLSQVLREYEQSIQKESERFFLVHTKSTSLEQLQSQVIMQMKNAIGSLHIDDFQIVEMKLQIRYRFNHVAKFIQLPIQIKPAKPKTRWRRAKPIRYCISHQWPK